MVVTKEGNLEGQDGIQRLQKSPTEQFEKSMDIIGKLQGEGLVHEGDSIFLFLCEGTH